MTTDYRALCAALLDEMPHESPTTCLARAALAQPEPVVPTDEELLDLLKEHEVGTPDSNNRVIYFILPASGRTTREAVLSFARAVLARWGHPAITPIPVSERLPSDEDCDAHGRCWAWNPEHLWWDYWQPKFIRMNAGDPYTHWLPGGALPLPCTTASDA